MKRNLRTRTVAFEQIFLILSFKNPQRLQPDNPSESGIYSA